MRAHARGITRGCSAAARPLRVAGDTRRLCSHARLSASPESPRQLLMVDMICLGCALPSQKWYRRVRLDYLRVPTSIDMGYSMFLARKSRACLVHGSSRIPVGDEMGACLPIFGGRGAPKFSHIISNTFLNTNSLSIIFMWSPLLMLA